MKFDYFKFFLPQKSGFFGGFILKPIIPIRIFYKDNFAQYDALIDSGADFCIFHKGLGEAIGIDVESGLKVNFGGVQKADAATAYLHEIDLSVGGLKFKTTVAFSDDISEKSYGILGQKGFFELFSVKFEYSKERIEITPKK